MRSRIQPSSTHNGSPYTSTSSAILASRNFAGSIEPPLVDEFRRRVHHVAEQAGVLGVDDVLVEAGGGLRPRRLRRRHRWAPPRPAADRPAPQAHKPRVAATSPM